MPRARKNSKFHYRLPERSGWYKDKMLIAVNTFYEGDKEEISVQDFVDFLNENGIELSKVKMPTTFSTTAKK